MMMFEYRQCIVDVNLTSKRWFLTNTSGWKNLFRETLSIEFQANGTESITYH